MNYTFIISVVILVLLVIAYEHYKLVSSRHEERARRLRVEEIAREFMELLKQK